MAAALQYPYTNPAAGNAYQDAVAITPSDTVDIPYFTHGVYVGGAGNIVAILASGATVTFTGVAAGTILPISVGRVKATLTTATLLLALYR